jgi:hypothetical protein
MAAPVSSEVEDVSLPGLGATPTYSTAIQQIADAQRRAIQRLLNIQEYRKKGSIMTFLRQQH